MRKTSVFRQIFKEIHKRRCRRLPAAVLSGALLLGLAGAGSFFSPAATVQASPVENEETNPDGSGDAAVSGEELTPEEQLQQELDQVYAMEVQSNGWEAWPAGPGTYGEAAIVMEVGTGTILYAKNIDAHHYPASITKLVTTLAALKNGNLQDPVTFSHNSVSFLKWDEASIGMKEGNQLTLEQALYATLLASANEAAYAVGESVGVNAGHDYNWFIQQMNEICRELGGTNSNFVNTNGLHDPNHYTCARDMALIGRELFQYPDFFRIAQTPQYTIPASATTEEHVFQQHHKMLLPDNSDYYPYAIGGKTGYTSDALSTLVTMADNGSMQLVCVVLKTHGINVYPDTRNLLEYAFQNFQKVSIAEQETSEDVEEILPYETAGYVVLPMEASFSDLSMELVPDGGLSTEAQLNYTYHGQPVGSARASLSDHYIKEHSAQPKDVSHKDQETETEDSGISDLQGKVILGAAVALLLILITALIRITRKRKQKTRRRRR